jgi:DNA-binding NarL/FixJ family response regulator
MTRVLIIDEHQAVRQALQERLAAAGDLEVVGCTGCWQEGLRLAARLAPDVVLLETKRSDGNGLAVISRLRAACPATCIVVLTSYPEPEEQRQALQGGATRYLLKEIGSESLVQEIRRLVHPGAPI